MTIPRRLAIRGCLSVLFLGCLTASVSTADGGDRPRLARVHVRGERDAYVLSRGNRFMSSDASIEDVEALQNEESGDFLWVRRGGREFLIRDARTMEDGQRLFEPMKALEPEQEALHRRQRKLESEQNALERLEEKVEAELEAMDGDEDEEDRPVAASSARPDLERRKREIKEKMRALEGRERELDAAENALDNRSDGLEVEAETALWRLVDHALEQGLGLPVR